MNDLLYIIALMMTVALTIYIGSLIMSYTEAPFKSMLTQGNSDYNVTNATFASANVALNTTWDSGFALLFILMVSASMILGALLPTNPIFFVPFLFVLILIVTVTAIMSNVWNSLVADPVMSVTAAKFTYIPFIMNNLPILTAGLGFMMSIIIYTAFVRR